MPVRPILLLGDPVLRTSCARVTEFGTSSLTLLASDLRDTLHEFRQQRGFGRGIAAPQIGSGQRVILVDLERPLTLVNPVIMKRSRRKMMLWDDCFSFPDILVLVKRNLSVRVGYRDLNGRKQIIEAEGGLSELLQHEIDHLDGILAIDRAIDSKHIILRSEFEKRKGPHPLML